MPADPIPRPRSVRLPCTEEEFRLYRLLASRRAMTLAELLRTLLAEEARAARKAGFRVGAVDED